MDYLPSLIHELLYFVEWPVVIVAVEDLLQKSYEEEGDFVLVGDFPWISLLDFGALDSDGLDLIVQLHEDLNSLDKKMLLIDLVSLCF